MSSSGVGVLGLSNNREGSQFHVTPGMAWAAAAGWRVNPLRSHTSVSAGNPISTASATCTVMVSVQRQLFCKSSATHHKVNELSKDISKLCVSMVPKTSCGYQLKLKFSAAASEGLA